MPITILRKLLIFGRNHGILDTFKFIGKNIKYEFRWFLDKAFDRLQGTDTSGRIELTDLDIVGDNRNSGTYYEPTSTALFRHIIYELQSTLSFEDFIFLDYGSGKGRVLLLASDYDFRSIIGIEFSRELHLVAEKNIALYRGRRQRFGEMTSIFSDATLYAPPSENLLVWFYNPFQRDVMCKVLRNLSDAINVNNSKLALVYLNPLSHDTVELSGIFQRYLEIKLPHDYSREEQRKCYVYFSWQDAPGALLPQKPSSRTTIDPAP